MAGKDGAAAAKSTAKKTATQSSTKKAAARKTTATKAAPARNSARPTAAKGRSGSSKSATKKAAAAKVVDLPVLEQEDPWTAAELAEVRAELDSDQRRLQAEVDEAEADLAELMRDSGEGSGDDQADAGAATWEREHELSLTNNAKELLEQIERALERIAEGTYGTCESCGNAIGKMRLQAFPRATLCLTCKQKQERR
ncbi:TraR/DksA C4-type zinc finger protein [Ornithinimicrobium murale]|uniref:TraR/DksA C4-type zinc finger protein n=1 Tax=Ornithinimicrobium murale TaxID=1050153 RepID=UPI000E0DB19B